MERENDSKWERKREGEGETALAHVRIARFYL